MNTEGTSYLSRGGERPALVSRSTILVAPRRKRVFGWACPVTREAVTVISWCSWYFGPDKLIYELFFETVLDWEESCHLKKTWSPKMWGVGYGHGDPLSPRWQGKGQFSPCLKNEEGPGTLWTKESWKDHSPKVPGMRRGTKRRQNRWGLECCLTGPFAPPPTFLLQHKMLPVTG